MTINKAEITVSLGQLYLDPENYRLNEGEDRVHHSVEEIVELQANIRKQLIGKNLSDLESSIFENGFLEVDKIVVRELDADSEPPKYLVVEGNRRTAAFKSLIMNNCDESGSFKEGFKPELIEKSKAINVILLKGDDEQLDDYSRRLMGIRHVSGPKRWGGYQSAKLINDMCQAGRTYKNIGSLLGLRPKETQNRHEAYLALQGMKNDPSYSDFVTSDLFSLFVEAVSAKKEFKIDWLGWNDQEKRFLNTDNIHRLYDAIISVGGSDPEIRNPTMFRDFVRKLINIPEVKTQIENGTKFDELDYDFDSDKRIRKINGMLAMLKGKYDYSDVEVGLLKKLKEDISELLAGREDS